MGKAFHTTIEAIAEEAGCTPQQAGRAVTAALRCLHHTAVTDQKSVTAAVMDARWLFGREACYHLAGLLEEARVETSPDIPWSEFMARFGPDLKPFAAVLDKWRRAGERPET